MAQKPNGDKHVAVTVVDKNGVSKTVVVEVEILDGRFVTKSISDIGVRQ